MTALPGFRASRKFLPSGRRPAERDDLPSRLRRQKQSGWTASLLLSTIRRLADSPPGIGRAGGWLGGGATGVQGALAQAGSGAPISSRQSRPPTPGEHAYPSRQPPRFYPSGSVTVSTWFTSTSSRVCTIPLGQRNVTLSTRPVLPRPKISVFFEGDLHRRVDAFPRRRWSRPRGRRWPLGLEQVSSGLLLIRCRQTAARVGPVGPPSGCRGSA